MKGIKPVILSIDNGPHDFVVEWWYFNGHLFDKKGKEYSFMDCFFKVDISKVNIPHLSPHLIEDIFNTLEVLKSMGVKVDWPGERKVKVQAGKLDVSKMDFEKIDFSCSCDEFKDDQKAIFSI